MSHSEHRSKFLDSKSSFAKMGLNLWPCCTPAATRKCIMYEDELQITAYKRSWNCVGRETISLFRCKLQSYKIQLLPLIQVEHFINTKLKANRPASDFLKFVHRKRKPKHFLLVQMLNPPMFIFVLRNDLCVWLNYVLSLSSKGGSRFFRMTVLVFFQCGVRYLSTK